MSWIQTLGYEESSGRLRALYDRVRGPGGQIDAILRLHALRPHTLEGHLALYKATLHHSGNRLPPWLLETIGVWVSLLNGCDYCVEHHYAGLERRIEEARRARRRARGHPTTGPDAPTDRDAAGDRDAPTDRETAADRGDPTDDEEPPPLADLREALDAGEPERALGPRAAAALRYAEKLTRDPGAMTERDVDALRRAGLEDGEILEVNQVASYFAYANRTVLGLGARIDGETLGLSPPDSDDARDWSHR